MNKSHQDKVTDFLDKLDIPYLAISTKFTLRKPKKIFAYDFVLSFFITLGGSKFTLRKRGSEIKNDHRQDYLVLGHCSINKFKHSFWANDLSGRFNIKIRVIRLYDFDILKKLEKFKTIILSFSSELNDL